MTRPWRLGTLYAAFAVCSLIVNLGSQALVVLLVTGNYAIATSILIGTAAGLLTKYLLDKHYIFRFSTAGLKQNSRLFVLYTAMGILTTVLFWSVEGGFNWFFGTATMRYFGAVLGLTAGYLAKYQLDKRYVFVARAAHG
jgi:putative flippase GtrA